MREEVEYLLRNGYKYEEIAERLNISIGMVKKYNAIINFESDIKDKVKDITYEKVSNLGLNAIVLLKIKNNYKALDEIMQLVDSKTDIELLVCMINAYFIKIKTIGSELVKIEEEIEKLTLTKYEILNNLLSLFKQKEMILEKISIINNIESNSVRELLMDILGVFNDEYAIKTKIDEEWEKELRKSGIIKIIDGIHIIKKIDEFIDSLNIRINNNKPIEISIESLEKFYKNNNEIISTVYPEPVVFLNVDWTVSRIYKLKEIKSKIDGELDRLRERKIELEGISIVNFSKSLKEKIDNIKFCKKVQFNIMNYLYEKGYVVAKDIEIANLSVDIVGYKENETIAVMITDIDNIERLLGFANYIYVYKTSLQEKEFGILDIKNDKIKVVKEAEYKNIDNNIENIVKQRVNSKNCKDMLLK